MHIDAEKAKNLYESGLSLRQCADVMDTTWHKIDYALRNHGVKLRSSQDATKLRALDPDKDIDIEKARVLYESGLSLRQCAIAIGIKSHSRIRYALVTHGVQLRTLHEAKELLPKTILLEKAVLLYKSGLSLKQCAEYFGLKSECSVFKLFKKYGIQTRTPVESRTEPPQSIEDLIEFYECGGSSTQIAQEINKSPQYVRKYLNKAIKLRSRREGVVIRCESPFTEDTRTLLIKRRYHEGLSAALLAKRFDIKRENLNSFFSRLQKRVHDLMLENMLDVTVVANIIKLEHESVLLIYKHICSVKSRISS